MRYALKVYYDGKGFHGSQIQPDKRTVEGELLQALRKFGFNPGLQGAARTDRGVSALGNVYAFDSPKEPIPKAINSFLPSDIRVLAAAKVKKDFHPRRHALEKVYKYFLLDRGYSLADMRRAAKIYEGVHSFHNYCRKKDRDPVRKMTSIKIERHGDALALVFMGESFLWEMVRRIVTALRLSGKGEVSIRELEESLNKEVKKKFPPSPPEGLVLWRIKYGFDLGQEEYSKKKLMKRILERIENRKLLTAVDKAIYWELETR